MSLPSTGQFATFLKFNSQMVFQDQNQVVSAPRSPTTRCPPAAQAWALPSADRLGGEGAGGVHLSSRSKSTQRLTEKSAGLEGGSQVSAEDEVALGPAWTTAL